MSDERVRADLVVVGGGVQGAALALEAARRGLRPVLLERNRLGEATSARCLRIVHGGFREVQRLALGTKRAMARERARYLREFPPHVEPLPCALPLRGRGIERPALLRIALALDSLLARGCDAGVSEAPRLPRGRVLSASAGRQRLGAAGPEDLAGVALWWDALVPDPAALVRAMVERARAGGALAFEDSPVRALRRRGGRVTGVVTERHEGRDELVVEAPVVVNASGPWLGSVAEELGAPLPQTPPLALAWNVVLGRKPPADCALALRAPRRGGQTFFLVPCGDETLIGTGHAAWSAGPDAPRPTAEQLEGWLEALDAALPGFVRGSGDVVRVDAGLVPAARAGSEQPARRALILEHGRLGGPGGLWSVAPPKLTTARAVARTLLARIYPGARVRDEASRGEPATCAPAAERLP